MVILPGWIDQVPTINFDPEKKLLTQLQTWAQAKGWVVSEGESLPFELRERTDVLLDLPGLDRRIRVAVLRKSRNGVGVIRLDTSNSRTVELVHRQDPERWRVEVGGMPIEDDLRNRDWDWLINLMFQS